jgi:FkbM family methyltransferase
MLFLTRKFRKQLFRDLELIKKQISALETNLAKDFGNLDQRLASVTAGMADLDRQVKAGINVLQQQLKSGIDALEEQARGIKNEVVTIEQQAETIKTGVAGIEKQFEITRTGVASIEQHAETIKSGVVTIGQHFEKTRDGVVSIEQHMEETRNGVAERLATIGSHFEKGEGTHKPLLQVVSEQIKDSQEQLATLIQARSISDLTNADDYETHNPEVGLMGHLYSFLPNRTCIDIGANLGEFSERLLQFGYKVYSFEPFPPVFDQLSKRLGANSEFRAYPYAIGAQNTKMPLHVVVDHSGGQYDDPTLYSTLAPHAIMDGMTFTKSVDVPVKTLASLHESGEVPPNVDLVKIDTEGCDLDVIRGMGSIRYPVVSAEFWDPEYVCGRSGTSNRLDELANEMKSRGYHWFIVFYRVEGSYSISFYCHRKQSVKKSWGNVFFFQDHSLFEKALNWCSAVLPETRFR